MKKIIIASFTCFLLLNSTLAQAALNPKLKMVGTMAGYGAVGGALLGTASLAFGAGGRSIARGASLGLYAGILLGGYIILNYEMKKRGYGVESKGEYYPDSSSPYENDQSSMEPQLPNLEDYQLAQFELKKDPKLDPSFYLNILQYEF
ncbi:MAG: hypothetical protein HOP07_03025 [Bacteriovoracaceae bacterium]|nr:hypothetical protein [Bacteriovoracaceae bacterium]